MSDRPISGSFTRDQSNEHSAERGSRINAQIHWPIKTKFAAIA